MFIRRPSMNRHWTRTPKSTIWTECCRKRRPRTMQSMQFCQQNPAPRFRLMSMTPNRPPNRQRLRQAAQRLEIQQQKNVAVDIVRSEIVRRQQSINFRRHCCRHGFAREVASSFTFWLRYSRFSVWPLFATTTSLPVWIEFVKVNFSSGFGG